MAATLLRFAQPIADSDGGLYEARVCGGSRSDGTWEGWIEFVPEDGGEPLRSSRETTQPNRAGAEYWATGLTQVYLEGALQRTLKPLVITPPEAPPPPIFDGPARPVVSAARDEAAVGVLDPFSVYEKGEAMLRKQLAALSAWHIVNILVAYELADEDAATLSRTPTPALIEKVIAGVQRESAEQGQARAVRATRRS
jgi:hypothetical protein